MAPAEESMEGNWTFFRQQLTVKSQTGQPAAGELAD